MKYILSILILTLCGCGGREKQASELTVSVLRGPSAIVFAQWMLDPPVVEGKKVCVRIIDSPQMMQAAMVKNETDLAVLPMVSAANLYNKGVGYRLAGCPIWGTLYLMEKRDIDPSDRSLYLFGAGTTPELLTRHYLAQPDAASYTLNFTFSSPRELLQAIYAGRVKRAVLSEPFIGMAMQRDSTFRIVADLNHLSSDTTLAFAQTAIAYHPSLQPVRHLLDSLLTRSCAFVAEEPGKTIEILEREGVFARGTLTPQTLRRCRIHYRTAVESQKSIEALLQLIHQYEPKAVGGRMPDSGFIRETKL